MGSPDLTQRGPNLIQGVQNAYQGVLDRTRGSGLCVQGTSASLRGSDPNDCISEYTTSSVLVTSSGLFSVLLEIATQTSCLHTVVRGTPDSGYRQWPPGPPQGRNEPTGGANV
jgi:hypothetical protein